MLKAYLLQRSIARIFCGAAFLVEHACVQFSVSSHRETTLRHAGPSLCHDPLQEGWAEYPAVVVPIVTQHYPMLTRNQSYTGIIPGKKLIVRICQTKAVAILAKNILVRRRWSKLDEWLGGKLAA
jgi:hypothetical protein